MFVKPKDRLVGFVVCCFQHSHIFMPPMPQPMSPPGPKSQTLGLVIALAILTMVGFLVLYFKADLDTNLLANNTALLSQQVARVETRVNKTEAVKTPVEATVSTETVNVADFPVVVIARSGLLKNRPEEEKYIQTHIVSPIKDYFNEKVLDAVSVYIVVPTDDGMPYDVVIIHKNGVFSGELLGKRGDLTSYWVPPCMDVNDCGISSEFKTKYPELMKQLNQY